MMTSASSGRSLTYNHRGDSGIKLQKMILLIITFGCFLHHYLAVYVIVLYGHADLCPMKSEAQPIMSNP